MIRKEEKKSLSKTKS